MDHSNSIYDVQTVTRMITIQVTPELHERIKRAAHDQGVSMNVYCVQAIASKLPKEREVR